MNTKMPKVITIYYPDSDNPTSMKVLQDRSSQVRAFYFERKFLVEISEEEYASNYAVYFLLNRKPFSKTHVYIGQSKLGAKRIVSHNKNKDFWTHCIMFVTDNNGFDANAIDYMEYFFINLLQNSQNYCLENVELRKREPNINYVDKVVYNNYLEQISFVLKSEGIDFSEKEMYPEEVKVQETVHPELEIPQNCEVEEVVENLVEPINNYYAKGKGFSGVLEVKGNLLVLKKDSVVKKPSESMLNWSDNGALYYKLKAQGEKLEKEGFLLGNEENYRVVKDIPFTSPSGAGSFLAGASMNGRSMFGIERNLE